MNLDSPEGPDERAEEVSGGGAPPQVKPEPGEQASGVAAGHKTFIELKCGPKDTKSYDRAMRRLRKAVIEAVGSVSHIDGYRPLPRDHPDPVGVLVLGVDKAMSSFPDGGAGPRYRPPDHVTPVLAPQRTDVSALRDDAHGGWDGGPTRDQPQSVDSDAERMVAGYAGLGEHPGHAHIPYFVVPRRWLQHVTRERGRGRSRRPRAFHEAALLLAYVVFMYRRPGRFSGDLLTVQPGSVCPLLGIELGVYKDAVRHLSDEGFVTRVLIRGLVPWDRRKKGTYTVLIPRVPKLRAVSRESGRRG